MNWCRTYSHGSRPSSYFIYMFFFPFPGSQKPGLIGARGVHGGGGDEEVT